MAILKVARMGHPILRKATRAVSLKELRSEDFQRFLNDMVETMREYEGIGLAAPQVHQSIRVAVIEVPENDLRKENARYSREDPIGLTHFINPKITSLTKKTAGYWEGCLSVPGLRGYVERPTRVKVEYLDQHGNEREWIAEGFPAVVVQHELDHLDGVLYVDKLADTRKFSFEKEFDRFGAADSSKKMD